MSLPKSNVQKSIFQEQINGQKIFYSYVNKSQQTLSMIKNQRLLIFNSKNGHLYYINQPKSLPFVKQIPKPKNIVADMNLSSIMKQLPGTTQINLKFVSNKDKNQTLQWNFMCDNANLCACWLKIVQDYKQMKDKQKNQTNNSKQEKNNLNTNQNIKNQEKFLPKDNPFQTNQLGYKQIDNLQNPKISPEKNHANHQNQIQKSFPPTLGYKNDSNVQSNKGLGQITVSPQKQIANQSAKNLGESKNSINQEAYNENQPIINKPINNINNITNQTKANINNSQKKTPNIPIESIINRSKNQQTRPQAQQKSNFEIQMQQQKNSRLTYKDQIQSIVSMSINKKKPSGGNNYHQNKNQQQIKYNKLKDWNYKFYTNPCEQVLLDFQDYAINTFLSILQEDRNSSQSLRVYLKPESIVIVSNFGSVEAKKIKSEFRNYHFIMESLKNAEFGSVIAVPLTQLIQYEGLVAMVKSLIPSTAPKVQFNIDIFQLKDLQRYTRIKNNILKKSTIYDLSQIYESKSRRLLYLNQLIEYLPVHVQEYLFGSSLRPEHILDNVNQFMQGGTANQATKVDVKVMTEVTNEIKKNVLDLAKELSCQDIYFANGTQIKDLMHSKGINMKYLPVLYNEITNKLVKKYVHSLMVAKIVKQSILLNLCDTRHKRADSINPELLAKQSIEKSIKFFIEGNSNMSNQLWKQIAMKFRQVYNISISNSDILGPYFLNCLMKLLKGQYDLTKINLKKTMFKDQNIIEKGFVVEIGAKFKTYYRWSTQRTQELLQIVKKDKKNYDDFSLIVQKFQLQKKSIPEWLQLSNSTNLLKEYMTNFSPPNDFQPDSFQHIQVYDSVGQEPPTSSSLYITKNYLKWCLEYKQYPTFKSLIDSTLQLIDLWLSSGSNTGNNIFHCQFYELLAKYYQHQGAIDDSINFLKESLAVCIRNGGLAGKKIGDKYFTLADTEMRKADWQNSLDNFMKAKANMENLKNTEKFQYPLTLMKISQLYLNFSQFQNCLLYAKQALEVFQSLQSKNKQSSGSGRGQYDQQCIKLIQIMTRAFEIQNKKNELYRLAQLSAAKYIRTSNARVYERLIKICLTAMIMKNTQQKSKLLQNLVEKTILSSGVSVEPQKDAQRSLGQLMSMSSQVNILDKLMFKYQSLERIVTDINGKKTLGSDGKEFMNLIKLIISVVGEEFLHGLVQQRELDQ